MTVKYPCKVSYKNSNSLLGYQPNTALDYFFSAAPCILLTPVCKIFSASQNRVFFLNTVLVPRCFSLLVMVVILVNCIFMAVNKEIPHTE